MMTSASLAAARNELIDDVSHRLTESEGVSSRNYIERVVDVATRLFSAIERHTHEIEEGFLIACGEQARPII